MRVCTLHHLEQEAKARSGSSRLISKQAPHQDALFLAGEMFLLPECD